MTTELELARAFMESHPEEAAASMEKLGAESARALLGELDARTVALVITRMQPHAGAECLRHLPVALGGELLETMPRDHSALLLRRMRQDLDAIEQAAGLALPYQRADVWEALALGVIQGLTEYLPISSSAHLRVMPALFGWDDPGPPFTAVVQLGTLAAVLIWQREALGWGLFALELVLLASLLLGLRWIRVALKPHEIARSLAGIIESGEYGMRYPLVRHREIDRVIAAYNRMLAELNARFAAEAVILGTCNRVEIYLSKQETVAPLHIPLMAEFLAEVHGVPAADIAPHLYEHADAQAARHLFRVASGLDSVVIGEGQIAGQVKDAYEVAQKLKSADIRVEVDNSRDRMQAKIRNAQLQKVPYMLVVGGREADAGAVAVRLRSGEDLGAMPVEQFLSLVQPVIETKSLDLQQPRKTTT